MKKYDENLNYIQPTLMDDMYDLESFRERLEDYDSNIYGFVIGHWTKEEEDDEDTYPVQFRNVIKKEDLTEEYLNDIDFTVDEYNVANEFIGILYYDLYEEELPSGITFVAYIDERVMKIANWHVI